MIIMHGEETARAYLNATLQARGRLLRRAARLQPQHRKLVERALRRIAEHRRLNHSVSQ